MSTASLSSSADRLMAKAGKTFYRAARLLPGGIRRDVIELYAFCRRIDDLADEPSRPLAERRRALLALAAAMEQGSAGELQDAGWPFAAKGTMPRAAAMLVRAALADLYQQQPETEQDLLGYAFGVAGTVGVMMAEVLHASPEGFGAAVALGMAMQLSNISRDVAEDWCQGRIYLPRQWVEGEAVQRAIELQVPADRQRVHSATERLLGLAEEMYEIAYDGIWTLPWRVRWCILAAAMCYREIGIKVGNDVEGSWQQRTVVSGPRKLWLICCAGLRLLLPRFWRCGKAACWPELGQAALAHGCALGITS